MRALILVALFLPAAAMAGPLDLRTLRAPDNTADSSTTQKSTDGSDVRLKAYKPFTTDHLPLKTINFGPFEAEIGGQNHHFATYHLQGTRILGGSLGGTVDGGEAKLELTWPTSH